jgi:maltose alpha-D-glucosyltransferase/alpha-amylase
MGRYLTAHGFTNSPLLLGEIRRIDKEGNSRSLAVVQSFVRNQGDGWAWTLDQFKRALVDFATHGEKPQSGRDDIEDYLSFAGMTGMRLAQMHALLAQPTEDEAFAPAQATAEDVVAWIADADARLDAAFEVLARRRTGENPADDAAADELVGAREVLKKTIARQMKSGEGSTICRIHGDFHLGQILVASGDPYIIDFEGEPGRPLAERRAKMSPLLDVAGLLRSLDYAVATTLDPKTLASAPLPEAERTRFVARLRDGAEKAFLDAYYAGLRGELGLANRDLLTCFMITKAAYEIVYEAANRPSWLSIPLQGLRRLVVKLLAAGKKR